MFIIILPVFYAVVVLCSCQTGWHSGTKEKKAEMKKTEKLPVVLLTGFEPFGKVKVNASWEAVRQFRGKVVAGHRVAVAKLRVVWHTPRPELTELIKKHQPAAVFSFGQGHPFKFTHEKTARNERGEFPDNRGEKPKQLLIARTGPDAFKSEYPSEKLRRKLKKLEIPFRVSNNAGKYLCEETAYVLELLKSKRARLKQVGFFHVPALNSPLKNKKGPACSKKVLAEFVRAVIETGVEDLSK